MEADEGLDEGVCFHGDPPPLSSAHLYKPSSVNKCPSLPACSGVGGAVGRVAGQEGGRGKADGAGSRRRGLIGFLDNSWYQKQVRSSHRLSAREPRIGARVTGDWMVEVEEWMVVV